jgi:hypothetical protein
VITPLYGNVKVDYTNNPGYFRRLVTEIDKKNQVKNTEVYEIMGDIGFILSNYKLLIDNSNSKRFKEFKGGILITDYYSKIKYGKGYNFERVTGNIDLKVRNKNKNARTAGEQCWGMFLTTTYEDGSQSEIMLYSWCVNSDPNPNDQPGPDPGSSGGENTQVVGKICGTYTFTRIGNGLTAEIHGLGSQAYNYSNNNHVSASWPKMCITFGGDIQTSNNASIAFNAAWNDALQLTDVWLVQHPNATSVEFQQIIETILRSQLSYQASYYALSIGGCSNIPSSNVNYCP